MDELAAMDLRVEKLESLAVKIGERLDSIGSRLAGLESRLTLVGTRLAKIEVRQEEFIRCYATKADLLEVKNGILMWVVSAFLPAQLLPARLKKFGL
jgi:hypothetical protein